MITFTRRSALVVLTFLLCLSPAVARADRIVAVGDIHGEYQGLVSILQAAGVIDARHHWSGGTTRFVQTGDFLDRGADVRNVMDLLMRLEKEAKKKRGEATILIGNHEVMNLTGYLRDVNPAAYAAFADKKSEKRRRDGYRRHLKVLEEHSKRYGQPLSPEVEAEWASAYPLGFIEYQTALGPEGKYGRWLRARSALTLKDAIIFLHGGLSPSRASSTLKEINERVRLELTAFDRIKAYLVEQNLIVPFATLDDIQQVIKLELARRAASGKPDPSDDLGRVVNVASGIQGWTLYQSEGPLWFRGFAQWTDTEGEPLAANLLNAFGAKHFVVGHTIPSDPSRILPRFGGKVFLIDTAMLRGFVPGGRPSALEIDSGRFTAIYGNERVVLLEQRSDKRAEAHAGVARSNGIQLMAWGSEERESAPARQWLGPRGKPLPFQTYGEVEQFLRTSRFVSANRKRLYGITKPRKVLVENGRLRANAVFRSSHVEKENAYWEDGNFTEYLLDSYRAEVAAYELGLLIGVDNIPPTVPWKLKGETGALQIFIEDASPPSDNYQPRDPVRWSHQMEMIHVFDGLVQNLDRHAGNLLIDPDGNLWMIDHTRSFGRGKSIHNAEKIRRCDRRVWERLKALDPETVRARLSPYLGPKEIDALLVRKHELIRLLQSKIDAEGEERILFTFGEETPLPLPATRRSMPDGGILLAARNPAAWAAGNQRYAYVQQAPAVPLPAVEKKPWLGPDGEPLPFANEDEILEFLRNAKMIKSFDIPVGVTQPKKVLLEMNGVRAHAVFRDIDVEYQKVRLDDGKFYLFLRDSFRSEVAAYRLGKLLGIDTIPPVVERRLFSRNGSLQLWVENAMTEAKRKEKKLNPPDARSWRRQLQTILIFDNLVNNVDRNMGNMLIDADWKVWMIDHTRTFGREQKLLTAKKISRCPRRVWERLNSLDDKTIRDAMTPYMGPFDIASLLKRRRLMIELLQKRIAAEGESKVLFNDDDPGSEPVVPSPTSHRGVVPWTQPPPGTIQYPVPLMGLADEMLKEWAGLQGSM